MKDKSDRPEGGLHKHCNPLMFSRPPARRGLRPEGDMESDWVVKNDKRVMVLRNIQLSHLHDGAYSARFTTTLKHIWNMMCRQMAFNISREVKLVTV